MSNLKMKLQSGFFGQQLLLTGALLLDNSSFVRTVPRSAAAGRGSAYSTARVAS